ncbi:MAG: RNA methyltransferase [Burkholderiales bacterium]|nr:MAG: RNA methyltransferase [Burkholderiales bacterium]
MKTIRSADNPGFRELLRLARSPRVLRQSALALLEGEHLCAAYAARHGAPRRLLVTEAARETGGVRALLDRYPQTETWTLAPGLFKELAQTATSAGMLALVEVPRPGPVAVTGASCLLLEDIQDPGNLGVLLRIAAAAGLARAWLSPHCAYAWSGKVLRAGQGAHFAIDIVEGADLVAVAERFPGKRVGTVVRGGASLFETALDGPVAFLFGNEGAGLSEALSEAVDLRLSIPMPGGMESLNVASAAAIVIFEKLRQDVPTDQSGRATPTAAPRPTSG